jgi:hypothetical protein
MVGLHRVRSRRQGQSVGNTNRGIDIGAYPLAKTIIAGLNIKLLIP